MTVGERNAAVQAVAADPEAGVLIEGTGGFRKIRLAGKGRGKSGGYRLITYFADISMPIVLITVFAKGQKDNLTKAERNGLATAEPDLLKSLRSLR